MQTISAVLPLLEPGVTRDFLVRHRVCPIERRQGECLLVAIAPDGSRAALEELSQWYQLPVRAVETDLDELEQAVERLVAETERLDELERLDNEEDDRTADVRELANQPPVIRYVNLLLREAYDAKASDVHLEATRDGLTARFRLDGVLVRAPEPPRELQHAVVSRLKTLAELDIAERRMPQDGRIRARLRERDLDLRVSTVPTMHGESVVLRLLDRGGRPVGLGELGMPSMLLQDLLRLIERPHGLLIVTGPTGSGKTTTLYSALQHREPEREKILTVEDPIEYELPGITQVPVARQAGVSFPSALRAILRQDPDVLMIGEMRDEETAEIAVQAAMTGHLVLTTLHTNDSLGAVPRLVDLGVAEFLIGGTVEGVLAQRLVRRVCTHCVERVAANASELSSLAGTPVLDGHTHRGAGCPECRGTGYRGRTGIFELLRMSDRLKAAVSNRAGRDELLRLAMEDGFVPMRQHGLDLVRSGITTCEEVLRVVQA